MKRRSAVKNLATAFAGLASLPAWALGWTPASLELPETAMPPEETLLAAIVETIIPETSTPGARSLGVHQFVLRMINDCFGEPARQGFQEGLQLTEQAAQHAFQRSFTACDARQRTEVLMAMSYSAVPAEKQFLQTVKALTIRGYMHSEYFLVNISGYKMAPGFYHGCVPLKS